ncbi:MAG: hypothetical protein ACOZCO_05915 [Bacteroidota bacterium]
MNIKFVLILAGLFSIPLLQAQETDIQFLPDPETGELKLMINTFPVEFPITGKEIIKILGEPDLKKTIKKHRSTPVFPGRCGHTNLIPKTTHWYYKNGLIFSGADSKKFTSLSVVTDTSSASLSGKVNSYSGKIHYNLSEIVSDKTFLPFLDSLRTENSGGRWMAADYAFNFMGSQWKESIVFGTYNAAAIEQVKIAGISFTFYIDVDTGMIKSIHYHKRD